ncbi:MAG: FkbM family methyltransferase [Clostridiales bacterium]|jgi:FkbM family methyltransferase|nr:FkbM family methyltransferase [Clostridiales bacterium]
MPDIPISDKTINMVDINFSKYMRYVSLAGLEDLQALMKNGLAKIKEHSSQTYGIITSAYNLYKYWGEIDPDNKKYELIENRSKALKEHAADFTWLYNNLSDYRSKKVLYGIVENWLTFSMASLDSIIEKTFLHYFDLDIIKCDENETFVDLGAYDGDTVHNFLDSFSTYKKIYCYEIMPDIFEKLKANLGSYKNIEFRRKGASDKNGTMFISDNEPAESMHKLSNSGNLEVPAVSIDNDIFEPVTFIKMDIEGGEQKALLGCERHIKEGHPKLAISIYHNNEDIWKCARIIYDMDPSYKFYLRYNGGNYYPSEFVLLAV